MKAVEENNEKIFTKNIRKDIIKKKYNPLNKDKGFYERMGLYMKKEKDDNKSGSSGAGGRSSEPSGSAQGILGR